MLSTIHVGDVTCEPGEIRFGGLSTVYLRDSSVVRVPLIVINGTEQGPTLWLGGAVHGNEVPGVEVIRRLTRESIDPRNLRGAVIACPVQNPMSYLESDRLTPHDGLNINRAFPGKPDGSLTERHAHILFQEGVMKADVVLDYHANADDAMDHTIVRSGGEGPAWEKQWPLARAFGITIAVSKRGHAGIAAMLHDAALDVGKPALTLEFSPQHGIEETSVRAGVRGTLNVLRYLDMIDGEIEPQTEVLVVDVPLADRRHAKAQKGGIVLRLVSVGEQVKKGQPLAKIHDLYGNLIETVESPNDGWVINFARRGNHTVCSGDTVAFVYGP